jgi:hypothetical protein
MGDHTELGVIIDTGHYLDLGAIGQDTPPTMSSCHDAIGASRSQRL